MDLDLAAPDDNDFPSPTDLVLVRGTLQQGFSSSSWTQLELTADTLIFRPPWRALSLFTGTYFIPTNSIHAVKIIRDVTNKCKIVFTVDAKAVQENYLGQSNVIIWRPRKFKKFTFKIRHRADNNRLILALPPRPQPIERSTWLRRLRLRFTRP